MSSMVAGRTRGSEATCGPVSMTSIGWCGPDQSGRTHDRSTCSKKASAAAAGPTIDEHRRGDRRARVAKAWAASRSAAMGTTFEPR